MRPAFRLSPVRSHPGHVLSALILVASPTGMALAGGPPVAVWERSWTPETGGWALADLVLAGPDGAVYTSTRPLEDGGGGNAIGLIRHDPGGTLAWSFIRDGVDASSEGLTDLELTDTGLAAVGVTRTADGPRTVLLDLDADGRLRWERFTLGPTIAGFLAPQLVIGPGGERVIATDDGNGSGVLAWFDADGTPGPTVPLTFSGFGGVSALEIDAAGNALLVSVSDFNRYIVQSIAPDGTVRWTHEEAGDGLVLSEAFTAITDSGDLVVAGSLEVACRPEGLAVRTRLWRLSPDGELVWQRELDAATCGFRISTGIVAGAEDGVLVLTQGTFSMGSQVTRIAADGADQWTRSHAVPPRLTRLRGITVEATGDIVAAGLDSIDGEFAGVRVVRWNPAGDLQWTGIVAAEDGESVFVSDLQSGPGGVVAIAATSRPAPGLERATILRLDFAACRSDLDDDGMVGLADLLIVLAQWGPDGDELPDLDADGDVDFEDLVILLAAWGACSPQN